MLANIISTLVTNGFHVRQIDRFPHNNAIIQTYKYDKLGAIVNYGLLLTNDKIETSIIETLTTQAKRNSFTPIVISDNLKLTQCQVYTNQKFFDFFGGIVNTGLILIPNLPDILNELGHNKLPQDLTGVPADLHEMYVAECFQFIMESPTRRYGIDRSFESLPDGVIIGKHGFMILIDSKAYSNGFPFEADDIKRFASYVDDFKKRYTPFFGNIFSFIVVSGHFNDSVDSISNRSNELYKLCNCKLSCITSQELGNITQLLKSMPEIRGSIKWENIFSDLIIEVKTIKKEIKRIDKDKMH